MDGSFTGMSGNPENAFRKDEEKVDGGRGVCWREGVGVRAGRSAAR